ncbi:hypothetical protein [Amycolatopsis tucumanensis]|uniref:Uncharacterized protein n=1 Tax=Amycolatopsis tucumanensis TaxID=401106 RepID=A0ABP7HSH0_9PSEU|nr:hypothetical protein [Amycolatopsis tucumanensis]MCF6421324.1 hypothetical protein [Amycolatopsis tucumanensis]
MTDARLDDENPEADRYDRATVEAVGKLTEALETLEVARGHLYQFHRMTGTTDFAVGEAVELLRKAGHDELADRIARELVGRNVLPGRWTFQVVEDFDDTYYQPFRAFERQARELTGGRRHLYEAELKRERRSRGVAGHEATPDERVG